MRKVRDEATLQTGIASREDAGVTPTGCTDVEVQAEPRDRHLASCVAPKAELLVTAEYSGFSLKT